MLVFLAGWLGCTTTPQEPEFDNPLDPELEDYVPPQTTITASPSGTINVTTAGISWRGNNELSEFAYRLDGRPFSVWSSDTSTVLEYLDEGGHIFEVKSRYPTGNEEDTAVQATFTVDAVPPRSLLLYPYRVEITVGETFTIELQAHEITGLTAIEVGLGFDTDALQPDTVLIGPFLSKDGGTVIAFSEFEPYWHVNVGVAQGPAEGVQGSGTIISFQFEVLNLSNSSALTLTVVDARGPNDEGVELATIRNAVVGVKE